MSAWSPTKIPTGLCQPGARLGVAGNGALVMGIYKGNYVYIYIYKLYIYIDIWIYGYIHNVDMHQ